MNPLLLLPVACMVAMFVLASVPNVSASVAPRVWNLLHLPAFCGLTILWIWVFGRLGLSWWAAVVAGAGLTLFFGVAIELHQLSVPGRYASRPDLVLNVLGVGLAVVLALLTSARSSGWNKWNKPSL